MPVRVSRSSDSGEALINSLLRQGLLNLTVWKRPGVIVVFCVESGNRIAAVGERASSQISALQQLLADLPGKHQDRVEEPTHAAAATATAIIMCSVGRMGTTATQDKTSVAQKEE